MRFEARIVGPIGNFNYWQEENTSFYLPPMLVRTYAPRGKTPILKEFASRDHVSAIGAITPDDRLFLKTYDHAISSFERIAFLGQLQRFRQGSVNCVIIHNIPNN